MYIRLKPRQQKLLLKILPTVKLNAYDIETYTQILHAVNNPVDGNILSQPVTRSHEIKYEHKQVQRAYDPNSKKDINRDDSTVSPPIHNHDNVIEDEPIGDIEHASMFEVIDNRKKQS